MNRIPALMLIACFVYGCQSAMEEQPVTVVSGEITNPIGQLVTFSFGDEKVVDTLDAENKFTTTLEITAPVDIRFRHGDEYTSMYLRPGDDLFMTLDPEQFDESITYTGSAANINNYLAGLVLLDDTLMSYRDMMILPEKEFLATYDSISDMKLALLQDFNVTDKAFIDRKKEEMKWAAAASKMQYPGNYKGLNKLDSFEVSENYYAFKEQLNVNDSSALGISAFKNYLNTLISLETMQRYEALEEKSENEYFTLKKEAMQQLVSAEAVRRELMYDELFSGFTYIPDDVRERYIAEWKALKPADDQLARVDELSAQWAKLATGNVAPVFTYASIEGDTISLEDFKGKLVYIDVWATWCGPCIREHPAMEKLQERFSGKDVVFIAVSIDSMPEPWQKMVAEKKLGGVHLFAPGAWNSTIIQDYMIAGIPRFILIDREGRIIDADAARPSGDIAEQLEDLLSREV